jgi:hypothetical protein
MSWLAVKRERLRMLSVTQNPSRSTCRLQVETQRQPRPQKWKVQPFLSVSYGQLRIVGIIVQDVFQGAPVDVEEPDTRPVPDCSTRRYLPTLSL